MKMKTRNNPHCGVFAGLLVVSVMAATAAHAQTVVVSPANMGNWAFDNRDVNGNVGADPTAGGSLVFGPATSPLGVGSANLYAGNGTSGGDGAGELRNTGYAGTLLSTITALSYSTYVVSNNGQQFPYLGLMVNNGQGPSDTGVDDILFFEPPYQQPTTGGPTLPDQGSTQLATWQTWNALTGGWWDDDSVLGNGGLDGVGTLADYLVEFPNASIVNADGTGLGGVRFDVGFADAADQFNGNVDNFSIGVNGTTTTYDFEPVPAPEPASFSLLGAALAGLGGLRRLRRVAPVEASKAK